MRYNGIKYFGIIFSIQVSLCCATGISSKLDFGNARSSTKLIDSSNKPKTISYTSHNNANHKSNDEFDDIGVICLSGENCNSTESTKSKDSIEADVTVHVKVNINNSTGNKSTVEDDTPDVPVILGTADHNVNDNQNVIHPVVISNTDQFLSPPEVLTTITDAHQSYIPPVLQTQSLFKEIHPQIDLNIEPLSSDAGMFAQNRADDRYRMNSFELRVPHFESSYHRHYFGENPPPQVWYTKTRDFKPKPTAKPAFWSPTTHKHHLDSGVTCSCKNEVPRGLQWYPSRRRVYNVDPGSQINDKLAPLN